LKINNITDKIHFLSSTKYFNNSGKIFIAPLLITDDRLRNVATSLFVKGLSYGEIANEQNITPVELRQAKKQVLSELKRLIYKQKRNNS
ncbi:hypothetical protein, partial [Bacteroides acidifaciens]|uniref:hypothetical protein n=1 Tax=Bacteroides acidifaciens TaxID=85831 RepID=UPI002603E819